MPFRLQLLFGRRLVRAGIVVVAIILGLVASASATTYPPFTLESWNPSPPQGFGDRQNSWAWSMGYFNGDVIVGTNRAYRCISDWELTLGQGSSYLYPPNDPDMACTQSPADLPMQAEIWNYNPGTNAWTRVYQSPNNIPNPQFPGKFVPPDDGYRTMSSYTESDGTQALYVGGVTTQPMWNSPVPPPRILRSTDGVNFAPIPQDPGTFMGTLPNASMRGMVSFNGQLFVINGTVDGEGVIIASSNPSAGDNAWQQVSPGGQLFYDMAVFNGWLYAGTYDTANGYSVYKTQATGPLPWSWIPVVTNGGYLPAPNTSGSVVSMMVSNGRLYVGTAFPAELIRINPDDTWDLVEGTPRQLPSGAWQYPLSGLPEGFGNGFNVHIWRMQDYNNVLYAGTYDSSIIWKNFPNISSQLQHLMGMDLYQSADGWYWTPLTIDGFGSRWDFGVRNFASTPYGLFLGTADDYYGLNVFRAVLSTQEPPPQATGPGSQWFDASFGNMNTVPTRVVYPTQLDGEVANNQPVLSWDPVLGAVEYHVWRASMASISLPGTPPEKGKGGAGNPYGVVVPQSGSLQIPGGTGGAADIAPALIPDDFRDTKGNATPNISSTVSPYTFPTLFTAVGTTNDTLYVDQPLTSTTVQFMYYVTASDIQGNKSDSSNLVLVPSLTPTMTFTAAQAYAATLQSRNRFISPSAQAATVAALTQAQSQADAGDFSDAMNTLKALGQTVASGQAVFSPDSTDLGIVIGKLERRLKIVNAGFVNSSQLN